MVSLFPPPGYSSSRVCTLTVIAALGLALPSSRSAAPVAAYQATGIKITEITATSASIWTRVTRDANRAADDRPLPMLRVFDRTTGKEQPIRNNAAYPNGRPVLEFAPGSDWGSIRGAALGAKGQTRVRFGVAGTSAWSATAWRDVDPQRDSTAVVPLSGLQPGTRYQIEVEARPGPDASVSSTVTGGFVTAPAPGTNASVRFCVMTCQQYEDRDLPEGFAIYPAMLQRRPDFFVNTGDAVYYDHGPVHALSRELARYHWARVFSFPTLWEFHRQVGSYFMKDDHDTLSDDCHPDERTGDFTFGEGVRVFQEQTALSQPPYRTIRWGRHLQVWLLEGRDFRSTRAADRTNTPTILGSSQLAWLERTVTESDATFRLVITPTPMIGPDRAAKDDNYANAGYAVEGAKIRRLLGRQPNLSVITGDRHWQYVTHDQATGLEEWSVGAASDVHAGGWNEDQPRPEHLFLRTKRGGFLSGEVKADGASPTLTLRLHDTVGAVVFEITTRSSR